MKRFSVKEMKELLDMTGELMEEETAHVHHCKEGTGNDRCYITNKGERTLFFCHHCGARGSLANKLGTYKRYVSAPKKYYHHTPMLPTDIILNPKLWPIHAVKWPLQAKLTFEDIARTGLCYSPKLDRVCVPVTFNGKYRGFIARRLHDNNEPKYIARYDKHDKDCFVYSRCSYAPTSSSEAVFIVEDCLSAIRIERAGMNAVALLGTSLTDSVLAYITDNFNTFVIWLDNDNADVKIKQAQLKKELELYGKVVLHKTHDDPKHYTDEQIREVLK